MNYIHKPEQNYDSRTDEHKREEDQNELAKIKTAARDPLLRRLVTAHILATAVVPEYFSEFPDAKSAAVNRCARWLGIIKEQKLDRVQDAEYLGWVAYNNGDYKDAAHWLELSKGDSAAALWLRAKLQRRAGKLADAANNMARAVELLKSSPAYSPKGAPDERSNVYEIYPEGPEWGFGQSAHGDLGGLRLARGD